MLSLTDRYTVPQVFFNEEHIGGAKETIRLLNEWDDELKGSAVTARDRFSKTIESEAGPYDIRLAVPTGPPAIQYMNLTVNRPKEITEVNGKHFTTLQLTKELIKRMPRYDLSTLGFGIIYYNSFRGSDAVSSFFLQSIGNGEPFTNLSLVQRLLLLWRFSVLNREMKLFNWV